jgi:UDP-glucuronate 4-epimerase
LENKKRILITGCAGFIGFHLAKKLSDEYRVIGFDNYNNTYYDSQIKHDRTEILKDYLVPVGRCELNYKEVIKAHVEIFKPDLIIHLAAFAAVRESMIHPMQCIQDNVVGTQNLIDVATECGVNRVIYASTSCVLAGNPLPWKDDQPTNHQLNPYGFTKRTNECQFKTSTINRNIGLRFFTAYGPWGRPDMAIYKFTDAIAKGLPIDVFNNGDMIRDFTHIDDIIQGIELVINKSFENDEHMSEIYNLGYGEQVRLMDFVSEIEENLGKKAIIQYKPRHPADTLETWSDTTKLKKLGYKPTTSIKTGIKNFVDWYLYYEGIV